MIPGPEPINARAGHNSGRYSLGNNSSAVKARKLFKPSTVWASLPVSTEIKFSVLGLGFCWGYVTSRVVFSFLWPTLPGTGRQSNESIFCLKFRVFRALDWLSSISGAKIMAQKTKIGQNFYPCICQPGMESTHILYGQNSPP